MEGESNNSSNSTITIMPPEESAAAAAAEDDDDEPRTAASQVTAVPPLMQHISSYVFRKRTLVVAQNQFPPPPPPPDNEDNDHPLDTATTAPAHCIHVQHCFVPSQTRVGIASQALVTSSNDNDNKSNKNKAFPIQIPRLKFDGDEEMGQAYAAEHDHGIIVAIEREDVVVVRDAEQQEEQQDLLPPPPPAGAGAAAILEAHQHDMAARHFVRQMERRRHYVRYGVGAGGTDGRHDLKPRFELPILVGRVYRFAVWGPHVYIACGNDMAWINFAGDEAVADFIYGLRQVDSEQCFEIFRHEQTLVVHGAGNRTPANTSVTAFDMFEYVDIFSLAQDGRPTHQDRLYLPRQSAIRRVLTQLVGPDKDQLLCVTMNMYHYGSQIRLIPAARLREEHRAIEAAEAAPSLILDRLALTRFVVRDLVDNDGRLRRQELLMAAQFQGLLSVPLDVDHFDAAVVPTTLFQPEEYGVESVRDVQVLDNVVWILVWNQTTCSDRVIQLGGQDGSTVLKSIPFTGESWRFL